MQRESSKYPGRLFLDHLSREAKHLGIGHLVLHVYLHLCFLERLLGRTEDNMVILSILNCCPILHPLHIYELI